MIPILPCRSIDDQIAFYESLGFEVTYRQKTPNVFASIQRGAIKIRFFVLKGYESAESYSTCYVWSRNRRPVCRLPVGTQAQPRGIPTRGIPSIGALGDMCYGVRQFLLTDPGGNIIRIGQPLNAPDDEARPASRLEKALPAANLLMYSKGDPETAARVIDSAMADEPDAPVVIVVQARILRAEAAHELGDDGLAAPLLAEVVSST